MSDFSGSTGDKIRRLGFLAGEDEKHVTSVSRRPTTHSTGARVSLPLIVKLDGFGGSSRPVNSGVRHASRHKRVQLE